MMARHAGKLVAFAYLLRAYSASSVVSQDTVFHVVGVAALEGADKAAKSDDGDIGDVTKAARDRYKGEREKTGRNKKTYKY
jgi:hypothetical protein